MLVVREDADCYNNIECLGIISPNKKNNFFLARLKRFQIITFTITFLFIYRLIGALALFFTDKVNFIKLYLFSIWWFVVFITGAYFVQWLIFTWIGTKLPKEKLKNKFFLHPIATFIILFLFLTDLPNRLREYGGGGGIVFINALDTIIFYAFISFLGWLLICWISSLILKKQRFQWKWYKMIIDKLFVLLPPIYKIILGLMSAIFVFMILFGVISAIFHYSGSDLSKIFYMGR